MEGAVAVPLTGTDCGLPDASSVKLKLALFVPPVCGAKKTLTVQLDPLITVPFGIGHGFVLAPAIPKSAALAPVMAMLVKFSPVLPVLESVTVCAELVEPADSVPNAMLVGCRMTIGPGGTPVPVS